MPIGLVQETAWNTVYDILKEGEEGNKEGVRNMEVLIYSAFAPVLDHRFVHGLGAWDDRWIHVTSGVENLHGMRFNCRPEVAMLTLASEPDQAL